MATKKKTATTKRKKATPAKKKPAQKVKTRCPPEGVEVLACGCDEAMAYVCDGSHPECANPNAVPLDDPNEVASSFPVDVKITDLPKKKPSPIIVDDPYDDRPVDKEKLEEAMKDLGPILGSDNVIVIEPDRPSGHCFYGVMLPAKLTHVMSEEARRLGVKISRFSDLQWFASCRDFVAGGPVTTTRDMLTQDHMKRLREFCKKSGVPFKAQWVFTT